MDLISTDLPIVIYNIPARSIVDMSVETMARLAELPRIAGARFSDHPEIQPATVRVELEKDGKAETLEAEVALLAHDRGHWWFSDRHTLGVRVAGLPVEEWLFFLTVPYACVFIYDCVNYFWPETRLDAVATKLAAGGFGLMLMLALAFWDRTYTVVTSVAGCACMGVAVLKRPSYLGRFFRSYFIALVPFFLVNGALTGGLSAEPVVWYDDRENLGVRLGTIPLDDVAYLMVLLWLVIAGYETRLARRNRWARSRVKQPHR